LGAINIPIFQSSTYVSSEDAPYHEIRYLRLGNTPAHDAIQEKLCALTGAEATLVSASGMAAVASVLMGLLDGGDHILIEESLYGGTFELLVQDFSRFGLSYSFIDGRAPGTWQEHLRPSTRMIYLESITNPCLKVGDLHSAVSFAKKHGLISVCDNTFASPYNFSAIRAGFDVELHSATKYLNGHSDITAGLVAASRSHVAKIHAYQNRHGAVLDPNSLFLLSRGLKTLHVRMREHNRNALALAQKLAEHPLALARQAPGGQDHALRVHYPLLQSHPDFARAKVLLPHGASGMLSFTLPENWLPAQVDTFLTALRLPVRAPSLGGVESLITIPAETSHKSLPASLRARLGISDHLVRLSVGLEDWEDLWKDLSLALDRATTRP
jgi:cystathionine gamma-synthase/cystathionine gamma-lyase/cystathionine beta-lyase